MSTKEKIIIGLMLVFMFLLLIGESSRKRINWYPSFAVKHKIPFGTYIAYNEAKEIWGEQLKNVRFSPYVFFQKNPDVQGTYLIYNENFFPGETNLKSLLNWVNKGNNLFIAGRYIDFQLLDTLGLTTGYYKNIKFDKTLKFYLTHPAFAEDTARFDKISGSYYFQQNDEDKPEKEVFVLGKYIDEEQDSLYNFVRIPFGKGQIFLHSNPYVFTNYFILNSDKNLKYFEGILSYLNQKKPLYWDIRSQTGSNSKGVFTYLKSNPAFLWAYRLVIIGLFLYILFEGKRKQRAIPVIEQPRNETITFTKTIADMYVSNKEHRQIALMHIKHFMDYVRTQLHIDTRKWDLEMMNKIAQKTKTDIKDVKNLFRLIDEINHSKNIKPEILLKLEVMIEKIKNN